MRYRILYRGVPIGDANLDLANDPAAALVEPRPAFETLRHRLREATRALATVESAGRPANSAALADGSAIGRELELRDGNGELVATDFIELAEWDRSDPQVTVWVRARGSISGVPARQRPTPKSNSGSSPP